MIQLCTVKPGGGLLACCCGGSVASSPDEYDYTRFLSYYPGPFHFEIGELSGVGSKKKLELM